MYLLFQPRSLQVQMTDHHSPQEILNLMSRKRPLPTGFDDDAINSEEGQPSPTLKINACLRSETQRSEFHAHFRITPAAAVVSLDDLSKYLRKPV